MRSPARRRSEQDDRRRRRQAGQLYERWADMLRDMEEYTLDVVELGIDPKWAETLLVELVEGLWAAAKEFRNGSRALPTQRTLAELDWKHPSFVLNRPLAPRPPREQPREGPQPGRRATKALHPLRRVRFSPRASRAGVDCWLLTLETCGHVVTRPVRSPRAQPPRYARCERCPLRHPGRGRGVKSASGRRAEK